MNQPIRQDDLEAPRRRRWRMSRRGFLIGVGIVGAGLAVGVPLGIPYARLKIIEQFEAGGAPSSLTEAPFAWFEVLPDSRIRLYVAKVEMGQGIHTALAQIALEELGITLADLDVVQATTDVGPLDTFGTSGSISVSASYAPLRTAAATLRELLRTEAAHQLQQPADKLTGEGRGFRVADSEESLSFHEIVANHQGEWEIPETAPALKNFRDFQVIGTSMPRVDIPAKVTGAAIYGYDMRIEGMKYGAIARPPAIQATLKSAQAGAAATVAGVHTVVIEDGFAGVVADSRSAAQAAVAQLETVWETDKEWTQEEIEAIVTVTEGEGVTIQNEGNAPATLDRATTHHAAYRTPLAVQTPLETQAALAEFLPDGVRVWVSTQMPASVRQLIAETLGVEEESVEIIPTYIGGGFGRKSGFEVAVEAVRLAKAAGVPVHVGWTRSDELRNGYFRPPTHHQFRANIDDQGRIAAIEHLQASGDVAAQFLPAAMIAVMGADFGAYRGAFLHYDIPDRRTVVAHHTLPVRTGWWRGLGLLANTFAVESFIDELAHLAAADPLQFRLDHLLDDEMGQRMRGVLNAVAERAGWETPPSAGRARGIACGRDGNTVVAEVAEISLDATTGKIRVHQMTAAMDCGLIINPDGAMAQIEGNIMWGVGSTLMEEIRIKEGQVEAANFDTYPVLMMRDAPHVEIVLLPSEEGKPSGVGEPPIAPVAAAIGNALFALTGQRVRQLPMTAQRIRESTT